MTQVFLQRIEISNFRAYGDNFSFSPPGPGVTLLTGTDEPGKSAFFEAIEWALTGGALRLEALTLSVSLEFVNSEGKSTRIERRAVREQENHGQFAEISSPTQQQLMELLRAGSWVKDLGDIGEYLRPTHLGQAIEQAATALAELKRDTLLRLSAARMKIAQGAAQKSSVAARIDRHTHEMWMIQPQLRDTAKTIQRIQDLDSQIRGLLLVKQEIERCQQDYEEWCKEDEVLRAREPGRSAGPTEQASHRARREAIQSSLMLTGVAWGQIPSHLAESSRRTQLELEAAQAARAPLPDLEYLHDYQASLEVRSAQLASAITEEHKIVAQIEQELLAAHALLQQHPELLSASDTLPPDEANAIDEAAREPGLQGSPSPGAVDELRNKLADQESELQQLREQQKRLADAGLSMSKACWRSRWPALLLEASRQEHDPLHAPAFIEILRNLVRDQRYQVFLSIHDEALADSMRRKLEGAGIECATCR